MHDSTTPFDSATSRSTVVKNGTARTFLSGLWCLSSWVLTYFLSISLVLIVASQDNNVGVSTLVKDPVIERFVEFGRPF